MWSRRVPAGPATVAEITFTDRCDGDFHVDGPPGPLQDRRQGIFAGEWTWLRQVHGAAVVVVEELHHHHERLVRRRSWALQ